jgi:hypothetical protein
MIYPFKTTPSFMVVSEIEGHRHGAGLGNITVYICVHYRKGQFSIE